MGTPNFASGNASHIFVVGAEIEEQWEWEDIKSNIFSALFAEFGDKFTDGGYAEDNRSYGESSIGSVMVSKLFGDVWIEIQLSAVIRSAYYQGANLDWYVQYCDGRDWFDNYTDIKFEYYSDMNKGMCVIQRNNAISWIESMKDDIIERIEKVFKENSDPYNCTGIASNGEGFYSKVEA